MRVKLEFTIKQLFGVICEVLGKSPEVRYDTTKPDGYPRRAADTTLLKKVIGFVPAISLEQGIREMRNWLRTSKK